MKSKPSKPKPIEIGTKMFVYTYITEKTPDLFVFSCSDTRAYLCQEKDLNNFKDADYKRILYISNQASIYSVNIKTMNVFEDVRLVTLAGQAFFSEQERSDFIEKNHIKKKIVENLNKATIQKADKDTLQGILDIIKEWLP